VLFSNDKIISARGVLYGIDEKALKSVKKHSEFFIDLAMQEYDFNKTFKPSVIALSSVICARKVSRISPEWNS